VRALICAPVPGKVKSLVVKIWDEPRGAFFIDGRIVDGPQFMELGLKWYTGQPLSCVLPTNLTISVTRCLGCRKAGPPDYFPFAAMTIISDKLKDILIRCGANAEYFPVCLKRKMKSHDNYFVMNVLEMVDCIDPQTTVLELEGRYIKRLALNLTAEPATPLFVISSPLTYMIGCSDCLAAEIEKARCIGMAFPSPEEWRNPCLAWR
jgi:hypothetical protein